MNECVDSKKKTTTTTSPTIKQHSRDTAHKTKLHRVFLPRLNWNHTDNTFDDELHDASPFSWKICMQKNLNFNTARKIHTYGEKKKEEKMLMESIKLGLKLKSTMFPSCNFIYNKKRWILLLSRLLLHFFSPHFGDFVHCCTTGVCYHFFSA